MQLEIIIIIIVPGRNTMKQAKVCKNHSILFVSPPLIPYESYTCLIVMSNIQHRVRYNCTELELMEGSYITSKFEIQQLSTALTIISGSSLERAKHGTASSTMSRTKKSIPNLGDLMIECIYIRMWLSDNRCHITSGISCTCILHMCYAIAYHYLCSMRSCDTIHSMRSPYAVNTETVITSSYAECDTR